MQTPQIESEHPFCNVAFEVKEHLEDLGLDGEEI
jgi:hypothetical protein